MSGNGEHADNGYLSGSKKGFETLRSEEIKHITQRRKSAGLSDTSSTEKRADDPNDDLSGLALSGGGIRSAIFCLGVCQALAKHGILKHMDYLSTVSGGGYMGGSLSWFWSGRSGNPKAFGMDANNFPYGVDKPGAPVKSPLLAYLRSHGNYLTPGNGIGFSAFTSVVIRGTFLNLIVWLPLMAAAWFLLLLPFQIAAFGTAALAKGDAVISRVLTSAGLTAPDGTLLLSWTMLGLAAVFLFWAVIKACQYSLKTKKSHVGKEKYEDRRAYEAWSGKRLKLTIVLLILAGIPQADALARWLAEEEAGGAALTGWWELGGSAAFLGVGLVLGYLAYSKSSDGGLKPLVLGGVSIFMFVFGILVFTFDLAVMVYQAVCMLWRFGFAWPPTLLVGTIIFFVGLAVWMAVKVNSNYISVHRYYRDRLMEAFMPDYKTAHANGTDGAFAANEATLDTFEATEAEKRNPTTHNAARPYHLINTNLILPDTADADLKRWKATNFLLSPLYSGAGATGWRKTSTFMDARLTLPTSVAISGAAANPNAGPGGGGLTANPLISLIMAFLNLRLGSWVPNPGADFDQSAKPNHFIPGLYELLGIFNDHMGLNEKRPFVQISDGGHFENLALYELIRRRTKVILCCDGGCDPTYCFEDLRNLIQRVSYDFGAEVCVGPDQLKRLIPKKHDHADGAVFPQNTGFADHGYFLADIKYADGSTGLLVYMKTTVLEGLDVRTLGYKMEHEDFPDETTVDQFFSKDQFDGYRDLGFLTAERMLGDVQQHRSGQYAKMDVPSWL